MKKTTLTVVLLLSIICAFGQKKAVNRAFSEAKMEKPNFQEARDNIKGALTNPETKDDAKTWYVAGFVENSYFEKDNVQKTLGMTLKDGDGPMYDALVKSYEYFLQAIALDTLPNEKGKIKPRYVKDIRKTLKQNIDGYANAGVYYFTQKEYKKACGYWLILHRALFGSGVFRFFSLQQHCFRPPCSPTLHSLLFIVFFLKYSASIH